MRNLLLLQLLLAMSACATLLLMHGGAVAGSAGFGSLIGIAITLLTRRSSDRALSAAVENPTHGLIAMYSGFALRYAVAILGLYLGLKILNMMASPLIGGFILMILVQAASGVLMQPDNETREA